MSSDSDTLYEAHERGLAQFKAMSLEQRLAYLRELGLIDENNELTPQYGGPQKATDNSDKK